MGLPAAESGMEATGAVSAREVDKMSRDQVVEWFSGASDEDLAEVVRTARRPAGHARRPAGADGVADLLREPT